MILLSEDSLLRDQKGYYPTSTVRDEQLIQYVNYRPTTLTVPILNSYCLKFTRTHRFEDASILLVDGSHSLLTTSEVEAYGISFELNHTLVVNTTDSSLHGAIMEFTLVQMTEEEEDWRNTTRVTVALVEPPCLVDQADISAVAGENLQIELTATRGFSDEEIDISDIFLLANEAFRTEEDNYCGSMLVSFIDDDGEQPFTDVNFLTQQISLKPPFTQEMGVFEKSYLRFSFERAPEL